MSHFRYREGSSPFRKKLQECVMCPNRELCNSTGWTHHIPPLPPNPPGPEPVLNLWLDVAVWESMQQTNSGSGPSMTSTFPRRKQTMAGTFVSKVELLCY
ncbi:hypothetical protein C0J52_24374 [Blattella germanica]|nr:hypothetical protein C0J52_24374 [Blattella germanica]